jgi:homogentisate 1,2-dioxygenase
MSLPCARVAQPVKFDKGLAFMFETCMTLNLTEYAVNGPHVDKDYHKAWEELPKLFDPSSPTPK